MLERVCVCWTGDVLEWMDVLEGVCVLEGGDVLEGVCVLERGGCVVEVGVNV